MSCDELLQSRNEKGERATSFNKNLHVLIIESSCLPALNEYSSQRPKASKFIS